MKEVLNGVYYVSNMDDVRNALMSYYGADDAREEDGELFIVAGINEETIVKVMSHLINDNIVFPCFISDFSEMITLDDYQLAYSRRNEISLSVYKIEMVLFTTHTLAQLTTLLECVTLEN